jgi:hypothetical protein
MTKPLLLFDESHLGTSEERAETNAPIGLQIASAMPQPGHFGTLALRERSAGIGCATPRRMNQPTPPSQPTPPNDPTEQPTPEPVNPDPKAHPIHPPIPTQPIHEGTDPSTPITEAEELRTT